MNFGVDLLTSDSTKILAFISFSLILCVNQHLRLYLTLKVYFAT